jgi:hypothetical protein
MTIPASVIAYLRTHEPHAYCDECISQKLGRRTQQVQPITATLGLTPGFSRKSDFCRECGLKRQVINASPKRGAGKWRTSEPRSKSRLGQTAKKPAAALRCRRALTGRIGTGGVLGALLAPSLGGAHPRQQSFERPFASIPKHRASGVTAASRILHRRTS